MGHKHTQTLTPNNNVALWADVLIDPILLSAININGITPRAPPYLGKTWMFIKRDNCSLITQHHTLSLTLTMQKICIALLHTDGD